MRKTPLHGHVKHQVYILLRWCNPLMYVHVYADSKYQIQGDVRLIKFLVNIYHGGH